MTNLILLALWTTAIYFIVRHIKRRKYHKSDIKFFRIYRGVHDLEQIVQQLEQLEEIQTSIELARFHRLRGVTITMPDNLCRDHNHTILVNGHDRNSQALMQLVLEERDRLRDTLEKKIKALDEHGTTELRADLVLKELSEVTTFRSRGCHFAEVSPADSKKAAAPTVHNKTIMIEGGELNER